MDFTGRRVVVMGLGRFGGGVGVTRFLCRRGAQVLVTDRQPADKLRPSVARIEALAQETGGGRVSLRLGGHQLSDFTRADMVVVNPAVDPRHNRFVHAAAAAHAQITSEIRLLAANLPNRRRTIGVTGTAGKSTVTAMIGHILPRALERAEADTERSPARVWVGGNIGGSLLDQLDRITSEDWVVLELSSFMLEGLREDQWSPHVAVVTNISPNHLDRHGSFEAYVAAKQAILEHQQPGDRCILGPGVREVLSPRVENVLAFSGDAPPAFSLSVPGAHNQWNAALACGAVEAVEAVGGCEGCGLSGLLEDFTGLAHRLQLVCEHAGVRYFNDSKSTTPDAAIRAIRSFPPGMMHVILGGYDKGSDLAPLAKLVTGRCRALYTIGATGEAIAQAARDAAGVRGDSGGEGQDAADPSDACDGADATDATDARQAAGGDGSAEVVSCGGLDRAVAEAARRVRRGEIVLLSPACASWDQYDNFEHRGNAFVAAVLKHTTEAALTPDAGRGGA